jgi:hypothetical protein
MVRNHYNNLNGLRTSFSDAERRPKKDTGSITLIESDNPNFTYEVYDYRGIFVGYMGRPSRAENEVLNKFRKNEENINSNILYGLNEKNDRTDIF